MKYINNILYLEFEELTRCGIEAVTIRQGYNRNSTSWIKIDDPADTRKVLIQYSTLKDQYKVLVTAKYGEPHKYLAASIIKQQLINNEKDVTYITNYTLPDGTKLPATKQTEYITACSFLSLLSTSTSRSIRGLGFATAADFYEALCGIIKSDSIALPTSYPKLKRKVAEYKVSGAHCVISKKWCNRNAKKVSCEISEATLLELISHSAKFDDSYICRQYNKWAQASGYKTITDVTVGNYRRKNLLTVVASRDGVKSFHNQFTPITKRFQSP